MAILSAKRSPTTLTTDKLMQKCALKESGKLRECLIKGVAKKEKLTPKSKRDSNPSLGCAIQNTVLHRIFTRKYGVNTKLRRIYGV
jgi:hypothetical protein